MRASTRSLKSSRSWVLGSGPPPSRRVRGRAGLCGASGPRCNLNDCLRCSQREEGAWAGTAARRVKGASCFLPLCGGEEDEPGAGAGAGVGAVSRVERSVSESSFLTKAGSPAGVGSSVDGGGLEATEGAEPEESEAESVSDATMVSDSVSSSVSVPESLSTVLPPAIGGAGMARCPAEGASIIGPCTRASSIEALVR